MNKHTPFIGKPITGYRYSSNIPQTDGSWIITMHDTEREAKAFISQMQQSCSCNFAHVHPDDCPTKEQD